MFIGSLAGGLLAAPLAVQAQPAVNRPRIGYLHPNLAASPHLLEAFRQGLRDLRYVDVFPTVGDPVTDGLVASLARPGGNIAGLSNLTPGLVGKCLI